MSIVTISRGSYTRGREVAEKLSEKLNHNLISREILIEASEQFNISEIKLERALNDPLSVLDRFSNGRNRYIAYIQNAILNYMINDNVVYHGLAGHALVPKVRHILRIRIRADMEDRIKRESERENISEEEARYLLSKDDDERRKWSIHVTGKDPCDPSQYDIVFNASTIDVEDMVNIIAQIVQQPYMENIPESQKLLEDLAKASKIKTQLIKKYPSVQVHVEDQIATIYLQASLEQENSLVRAVKQDMQKIEAVQDLKEARVNVSPWLA